jgi:hypothetical protein
VVDRLTTITPSPRDLRRRRRRRSIRRCTARWCAARLPLPLKAQFALEGEWGGGGGKPKKPGKTIDWGKYNYLLEALRADLRHRHRVGWRNRMIMKISEHGARARQRRGQDVEGSETRRTIMPTDVVFDPTRPAAECVNLFGGIELEPSRATSSLPRAGALPHSRASDNADECDNILHWLLCWLAYPLQHPGAKLRTAVIMHGDEGAGKNFLFECVLEIYGRYGALVGQDELEDKFNDWRSGKCMVIGDEVSSRQELVHNKNRLKALITSPTVQINPKNLPGAKRRTTSTSSSCPTSCSRSPGQQRPALPGDLHAAHARAVLRKAQGLEGRRRRGGAVPVPARRTRSRTSTRSRRRPSPRPSWT